MHIRDILDPRHIVLDVPAGNKPEILRALAAPIAEHNKAIDHDSLVDILVQREETSTTAIADGIAIPHGKLDIGKEVICGFGRSLRGVDFQSVDGNPTHLFFVLISPERHPSLHLRWLAHLAVMLKNPTFRKALLEAASIDAIINVIDREETALSKKETDSKST